MEREKCGRKSKHVSVYVSKWERIVQIENRLLSPDWSLVEFIRDELEIEAADPSHAQLLQLYLRKSPKNYQWTFLSNRSIQCFVSAKLLFTPKAVVWMKGMTECTSSLYHSLQVF